MPTRNQEFNKNKANIRSYTKIDGNIGYDLYNNNDVLYDVGNNNFSRSLWQEYNQQSLRPYDTYNPEQNIELGVQVIKRLQNSIHNPTIEKVATLYNSTGAMQVNDYGARTKTIYEEKPWNLKFKLR